VLNSWTGQGAVWETESDASRERALVHGDVDAPTGRGMWQVEKQGEMCKKWVSRP